MEMGYDRQLVERTLRENSNDVYLTVEQLLHVRLV